MSFGCVLLVQVLDLGSGRGYLSQYLAMKYSMSVVGVDAEGSNTHSAMERNRKALRALKSVLSGQKRDVINSVPSGGRGNEQTATDRLPKCVGTERVGVGTQVSPGSEKAECTEQATLPAATHPPTDAVVATATLKEVQTQCLSSPLRYQSSTQPRQDCKPGGHEPSRDSHGCLVHSGPCASDKLLRPFQIHHHCDRDDQPEDACWSLQGSTHGEEHDLLPTAAVVSNSDSNSNFASPQSHSHVASPQSHSHSAHYTPVTGLLSLEDEPDAVIQLAEEQSGGSFQRERVSMCACTAW